MALVNLADAFIGAAKSYRDRIAISSGGVELSYEQMVEKAFRTARRLAGEGVRSGDLVGVALTQPGETIVVTIGLWMLGATVTYIDFRSRAEERAELCEAFAIKLVIEDRRPPGRGEYATILADADWSQRVERESSDFEAEGRPKSPALISLTSGTTGKPQGIVIEHSTFLLRYMMHHVGGRNHPDLVYLNPLPLNYSASRNHTLGRLLDGGTVHFVPFLSTAEELCEQFLSRKVSYTLLVPSQVLGLLKLSDGRDTPMFPALRTLYCGGAPLGAQEQIRAYRELSHSYRMLYASSVVGPITNLYGEDIIRRADTVGRPLSLVNLEIVSEAGEKLPVGETGIIRVRSPAIATGVVGRSGAPSDRIAGGWAYPGDIGLLDEEGYLKITGRASDMIIRGGANVFPEEVEAVLGDHPAVAEVAVVGVADENVGEEIAAFVVATTPVSVDELTAFARSRLSPDKRPRLFYFVDSLPRGGVGKVLRRELLKLLPGDN